MKVNDLRPSEAGEGEVEGGERKRVKRGMRLESRGRTARDVLFVFLFNDCIAVFRCQCAANARIYPLTFASFICRTRVFPSFSPLDISDSSPSLYIGFRTTLRGGIEYTVRAVACEQKKYLTFIPIYTAASVLFVCYFLLYTRIKST